jgi:hypothetical protein
MTGLEVIWKEQQQKYESREELDKGKNADR